MPRRQHGRGGQAEGNDRQEILRGILHGGYPFLLGNGAGGFDLATATFRQFREQFQSFPIQGETLRKAEAFFLNTASDAGLTISPYIRKPTKQPGEARRSNRPRNGQSSRQRRDVDKTRTLPPDPNNSKTGQKDAPSPPTDGLLQAFLTKLPDFNPEWKPEVQTHWFEALKRLMALKTEGSDAEGSKQS